MRPTLLFTLDSRVRSHFCIYLDVFLVTYFKVILHFCALLLSHVFSCWRVYPPQTSNGSNWLQWVLLLANKQVTRCNLEVARPVIKPTMRSLVASSRSSYKAMILPSVDLCKKQSTMFHRSLFPGLCSWKAKMNLDL